MGEKKINNCIVFAWGDQSCGKNKRASTGAYPGGFGSRGPPGSLKGCQKNKKKERERKERKEKRGKGGDKKNNR